jgi:hypothetical protein
MVREAEGGSRPAPVSVAGVAQTLTNVRPEFLNYFWNSLDKARYETWSPAEHETFEWTTPPAPGELVAEAGASYASRVKVGTSSPMLTVTYLSRTAAAGQLTSDDALVADVTFDGRGPYRLVVQYALQGDDLTVQQTLGLPDGQDVAAWNEYLKARMTRLAGFVRAQFQADFVEQQLTSRGEVVVHAAGTDSDVVVTQNIAKLTPEMVDWWWDNMGGTERYRRWHPTAHKTFVWTTPPTNPRDLTYDVGAVQQVVETIGSDTTLNISWRDPSQVSITPTYRHYLYGGTLLDPTPFGGYLVHEYQALGESGIVMKSTFRIPAIAGADFAQALGDHCIQEMQFLQYFLPALFAKEYTP